MDGNGRTGLPGTGRGPRNVLRLLVLLGVGLAGGFVLASRPMWWPEAVVVLVIASLFALVPAQPREEPPPWPLWPPWRGRHPVRNTVAFAFNAIAFVMIGVAWWLRPGMVGSELSMAVAFTLVFASAVLSTRQWTRGRRLNRAILASLAIMSYWSLYQALTPRTARLPTSQSLEIRARVDRGPQIPSTAAPELSIAAPGGRTSGFDRASGTIQRALPNTYYTREASAHSEEERLSVSASEDGTYALEVIGTAAVSYDLHVSVSDVSKSELLTTARHTIRDVPIAHGAVHRYDVEYSHEPDGMARVRLVPRDAPAPRPRSVDVREVRSTPGQLSFKIGAGCGGGPPTSVRLSTPGGRSARFGPRGATQGEDLPGLRLVEGREPFRGFVLQDAADGEYVLEVSSSETSTPYSLYVSFDAAAARYTLQQQNCARTTVAAGEVHRWTVRLEHRAEVPLRIGGRSAFRAPELPQ